MIAGKRRRRRRAAYPHPGGASSLSLSDQPLIYINGIRVANDIPPVPNSQFFGSAVITRLNDIDPDDIPEH